MNTHRFGKWVLGAGFIATLTTANLTASKLAVYEFPVIGETTGSVAAFMIGISFLLSDLSSEIYGKATTRYLVNAAILSVVMVFGLVAAALAIPAAPAYESAAAFQAVFAASPPILIASIIGLTISQNLDIEIFHRVRRRTGGRHRWLRNCASTGVSQLFDTSAFTLLAFVILPPLFGSVALPLSVVVGIILTEYLIKLIVAAFDTVAFYGITGLSERSQAEAVSDE
jgi:hypothetical protein